MKYTIWYSSSRIHLHEVDNKVLIASNKENLCGNNNIGNRFRD